MRIEKLVPQPRNRVYFNLTSFKLVPKQAGCYVLATFKNKILYIGLSDNLHKRFQQHLENPEKTNQTADGKAAWFYFIAYNPKNLLELERTWINHFMALHGRLPILNKMNSPVI